MSSHNEARCIADAVCCRTIVADGAERRRARCDDRRKVGASHRWCSLSRVVFLHVAVVGALMAGPEGAGGGTVPWGDRNRAALPWSESG